jgi:hypothetical protein
MNLCELLSLIIRAYFTPITALGLILALKYDEILQ